MYRSSRARASHWLSKRFNCQDPCWPLNQWDSLSRGIWRHLTEEFFYYPNSGAWDWGTVGCPLAYECHQLAQGSASHVLSNIRLCVVWLSTQPPRFLISCAFSGTLPILVGTWMRLCTLQMKQPNSPSPRSGPRRVFANDGFLMLTLPLIYMHQALLKTCCTHPLFDTSLPTWGGCYFLSSFPS